jgi:hypothetical protein
MERKDLPQDAGAAGVGDAEARVIDSRSAFAAALHWGVGRAIERGARRIVGVDVDFSDWPLDDPALLATLGPWLRRPQRELVLLASSFDEVALRHPRFVAWRRLRVHAVPGWRAPEDLDVPLPTMLLDDGPLLVQLTDRVHWRGRAALDAHAARLHRDEIDALIQRSEAGFPASHLGL